MAAPANWVVHSLFGDRTCGALATVICGAGLRLTTVDEMVTEFMDALLNRTPCADSKSECNWISRRIRKAARWVLQAPISQHAGEARDDAADERTSSSDSMVV